MDHLCHHPFFHPGAVHYHHYNSARISRMNRTFLFQWGHGEYIQYAYTPPLHDSEREPDRNRSAAARCMRVRVLQARLHVDAVPPRDESGNGKIPYCSTPYSEYTARIPNWREKQEQETSREIWSGTGTEVVEAFSRPYFRFPI